MVKSARPVKNVSPKEFVVAVLAHANRSDGCIDTLAAELGLTPKSAYARYAKYRREIKAATGQTLPKLSQSVERKVTINWRALADMMTQEADNEAEAVEPEAVAVEPEAVAVEPEAVAVEKVCVPKKPKK